MIIETIEIPISIHRQLFEYYVANYIKTVTLEFLQSDNLHHKYNVSTKYPIDLFEIGRYVGGEMPFDFFGISRYVGGHDMSF